MANSSTQSALSNFSNGSQASAKDIIKASAYVIIMAVSLCGNVLVLVVVKKNVGGRMRTVSNYLLTNMATVDLVITLGSMPERLTRALTNDEWLIEGGWGTALCKVTNFFEKLSLNVSILNIVLIATDRFLVVMFPHKTILTARRTFVAIAFAWILSVAYCFPILYYGGLLREHGQTLCRVRRFFPNWKVWYLLFLVELLITLLLVVLLYTSICYKIWRRKSRSTHQNRSSRNTKVNRKVLKMAAMVLLAFYACFLPYWISWVFCSYHFSTSICSDTYVFIAIFLSYLNSSLNPIIYCSFSEAFRDAFKSVFQETCPWILCCRKQVQPCQRRAAATVLAEFALVPVIISPRNAAIIYDGQENQT